MVKLTFILLQLLLAASVILAKSIPADKELIHIGSFISKAGEKDGIQSYNENNYYVSPNSAIWQAADADCRIQLGVNATLVSIESEAEWEFLRIMLENYGFGTTYWTSGMYDPSRQLWRWTSNNQALPPFAAWGPGFPSNPNQLLRVNLAYTNRYDAFWQTQPNTQLHRYVCELQIPTIAVPCYETNDLAIVLDASGSIGAANFVKAVAFVEELAAAFTRHALSRLTYVVYSTSTVTRIPLVNSYTPAQIGEIIRTTPYTGGGTATHLGIDMAVSQFNSSPRDVVRNLVVLTDGISNNPALTVDAANRALALGIRNFSVGITPSVNMNELLAIAGHVESRVFTSDNFENLIQLLAPLSLEICP